MSPIVHMLNAIHWTHWLGTFGIVAGWLIAASVDTHFAASNLMLAWVLTGFGCLFGHFAAMLRDWPGATVVPGFTTSLLSIGVGILVAVAAMSAGLCWLAGNPAPGIGPALLLAMGFALSGVRFGPQVLFWTSAPIVYGLFFVLPIDELRLAFAEYAARLSHPSWQIGALPLFGVVVLACHRVLKRPASSPLAVETPTSDFGVREAVTDAALGIAWLGGFVLVWSYKPHADVAMYWGALYLIWAFFPVSRTYHHIHSMLAWRWIVTGARSRADLGRRFVTRLVLRAFRWAPAGILGTGVHAASKNPEDIFMFQITLLAPIAALTVTAVVCGVVRRWPQDPVAMFFIGAPLSVLMVVSAFLLSLIDYSATGYLALALALLASIVLTVVVGGRGLARAEIVE